MRSAPRPMVYPNPDMLLFIGMADAYAAAAEYNATHTQELLRFKEYMPHPTLGYAPGRYTDDTHMSLAVTQALLSNNTTELHEIHFAREFVTAYRRDPRPGYSSSFAEHVLKPASASPNPIIGGQLFLKWCNRQSDKNGAAMRSVPIGVLPHPGEVLRIAKLQAMITHNTVGGIASAQLVALMSHYALYESAPLRDLPDYLRRVLPAYHVKQLFNPKDPWHGPVGALGEELPLGIMTAQAVLTLVSSCDSLMAIMRRLLMWGGDTDTVAAIAWGIASARYQDETLPVFMRRDFEADAYGSEYLRAVGRSLTAPYTQPFSQAAG